MGFLDTLQARWNRLAGEEERRQRVEQEIAKAQAPTEADRTLLAEQEAVRLAAEAEKQRAVERLSPAERLLERDLPQPAPKQEPEPLPDGRQVEATRMELTRNIQPAPSQPGPGSVFVNARAVQRPVSKAPEPVQENNAQPPNAAQPVRNNEERQATAEIRRPASYDTVAERIQRNLRREKEAQAVLEALEKGRIGKTERENERGGRRMT